MFIRKFVLLSVFITHTLILADTEKKQDKKVIFKIIKK